MKRTPRSTNRNARPAIAHPGITRRTFIQRTAAASAATAFGLHLATYTAHAVWVQEPDGFLVTYTGNLQINITGAASAKAAWSDLKAALEQAGATITPNLKSFDNYFHRLDEIDPQLVNSNPEGSAGIAKQADGTWKAWAHGPTSFQVTTHKLVQIR